MQTKAQKRELAEKQEKGLSVKSILIVAVLIAAGAVLKIFSNTIFRSRRLSRTWLSRCTVWQLCSCGQG